MDILCLPYAGGSKSTFFNIKKHTDFNIIDYELPGRGRRIRENNFDTIKKIVEDILDKVTFNNEYIIWGHSMGGYIAYELIKQIENKEIRKPKKVIISAQVPPTYKNKNKLYKIINLDDENFIKFLIAYGGTNPEVFENKEQIEVSKFYEKLPKPQAIAVKEWLDGDIYYRYADEEHNHEYSFA